MRRSLGYPMGAFAAVIVVVAGGALSGCRKAELSVENILAGYREGAKLDGLSITYPFDGALFPPEIAPPTFRWEDSKPKSDAWLVTIRFQDDKGPVNFLALDKKWTPSAEEWEAMKKRSLEKEATVTVLGVNRSSPKRILSGASVSFATSKDEAGAPVFYRDVNLPFVDAVRDPSDIRWRLGSISSPGQPPVVLEKLPVCGNCHSFSSDGRVLGMDVDYANDKGSYAVTAVTDEAVLNNAGIITWSDYKKDDGQLTFGLLSQVSPDGNYAVSTVKDRSVFVAKPEIAFSQLFFPLKGILCVYNTKTKEFAALPGADDPEYVQSNPTWSPDGKYIVFARNKAYKLKNMDERGQVLLTEEECREFLQEGKTFLFDLYRIPFNEGRGGEPEPLEGASNNGMSNFFAKYSPDGKWIVFCKSKSFMLLQPDSELHIVPAGGGEARRLRCNTTLMNSWHSWSPNGRWLVFSSKVYTPYTQLFLTHIDDNGDSTQPVLLESFVGPGRAANIPEFVNLGPSALKRIREEYIDVSSLVRAGDVSVTVGDLDNAIRYYRMALEIDPKSSLAHFRYGQTLDDKGDKDEAITQYSEAVRLDPNLAEAHMNLALCMVAKGDVQKARYHLTKAATLAPESSVVQFNLGRAMYQLGRLDEAITYTRNAVRINADYVKGHVNLGGFLLEKGILDESVFHSSEAVRLDPENVDAHNNLGEAMGRLGRIDEAEKHFSRVLEMKRDHPYAHYGLAKTMVYRGKIDEGIQHYIEALRIKPDLAIDSSFIQLMKDAGATDAHLNRVISAAKQAAQWARSAGNEDLARRIEKQITDNR